MAMIEIDDEIVAWAQARTGNSTRHSRFCCEHLHSDPDFLIFRKESRQKHPQEVNSFGIKKPGTSFIAQMDTVCPKCGMMLRKGTTGVKWDVGSLHPDCYEQLYSEGRKTNG